MSPSDEPQPRDTVDIRRSSATIPNRIGHYTIQKVIASGGMGTVYKAVQEKPRRAVAIKVMRAGVQSATGLRRFEFEAQLLARLRHPNIAQIYEAGTHDEGGVSVPFFAMEYIPNAKSITRYAREKNLTFRECLALFAQACEAVHHGHQKGIIHRDLKPENILVGPNGTPRIIDFGVARATDSDMALTQHQTDLGQLIGTLQYMSPEQCEADPHDIDTRSDVYSLGVVLYELLTEQLPYDVSKVSLYEAANVIRTQDPLRPSTTKPKLRGDLETIVLKAMHKERDRRYQSAAELAQDMERYLRGEAIAAQPASAVYQLRVMARRHKGFLAAASTVFLVLVVAGVLSGTLYLRGQTLELRAQEQEASAQGAHMYLDDVMSSLNMIMGDEIPVARLLETFEKNLETRFAGQPAAEASVRMHLARRYGFLAMFRNSSESQRYTEHATENLQEALRIQREIYGEANPVTLASIEAAATHLGRGFDLDEAESRRREALDIRLSLPDQDAINIMMARKSLANVLIKRGKLDEAEALNKKVLEFFRDRSSEGVVPGTEQRALILELRGEYGTAEELYYSILDDLQRNADPESRQKNEPGAVQYLARALVSQGKFDEAADLYDQRIPVTVESLGIRDWLLDDHNLEADRPTLLVFWEEWCPWCQLYIPLLDRSWEEAGSEVQVVGLTALTWDKKVEDAVDFARRNGFDFPHAIYDDDVAEESVGPISYPMAIAIQRGRVLWRGNASLVTRGLMAGLSRDSSRQGGDR